ncbi:MAG TPA: LLM class flavin-dependent oxidoreductase [Candidatus Binatia bacterium]|nr:LLM class flavin-dependent oxidoreductase [Candidatus Binatia bacterium]
MPVDFGSDLPHEEHVKFGLNYAIYKGPGVTAGEMFHETVEEVVLAESLGFDCALVSEHHFVDNDMFPSPVVALAYLAAKTSRIRVGGGVFLLPLYDPLRLAEDTAVLDVISRGRFILGIGQGYRPEEFQAFGRRLADRPSLMREGVRLVRRLWTEPSVTHEGKHFRVKDVCLTPKPVQPSPPVWVAAKKRKAVELAAEIGDGWYADPITPISIIKENKAHWTAALRAHGKDPARQTFAYYREFFVGADDDSAWKIGGENGVMGEYEMYSSFGHLVDDDGRPLPANQREGLVELAKRRTTVGGPERCRADLEMIRETLAPTHVVLKTRWGGVPHAEAMRSIRRAGEQVIPQFADA